MDNIALDFRGTMKWVQLILDSVNDGILIADRDLIVHYVNPAYLKITGIKHEDIIGKRVDEVRKGAHLPISIKTGVHLENIKRSVNGVEYIVNLSPIVVEGKIVGGITIARDMTQINNLIRKVENYSKKVEQLENTVKSIYKAKFTFDDIIGSSKKIEQCKQIAQKMAASDMNIMIRGESGTGKELFAHAMHNCSARKNWPFVAINCAAFPSNLLLSELFGYEPGAFTGASKKGKIGLFEIADGGTLFLDEIGDLDFELQSKLLRVIETGEYLRVGATKPTKVNIRLIAATNKDLEYLIETNKFREDLYFRLNVVPINIPPLRERKEDIPLIVSNLLLKLNRTTGKNIRLAEETYKYLQNYDWPGNVRQLKNVIEFAYNMSDDNKIEIEDLPNELNKNNHPEKTIIKKDMPLLEPGVKLDSMVEQSERDVIITALRAYGSNLNGKKMAAKHLGVSLATLYNKINKYGI